MSKSEVTPQTPGQRQPVKQTPMSEATLKLVSTTFTDTIDETLNHSGYPFHQQKQTSAAALLPGLSDRPAGGSTRSAVSKRIRTSISHLPAPLPGGPTQRCGAGASPASVAPRDRPAGERRGPKAPVPPPASRPQPGLAALRRRRRPRADRWARLTAAAPRAPLPARPDSPRSRPRRGRSGGRGPRWWAPGRRSWRPRWGSRAPSAWPPAPAWPASGRGARASGTGCGTARWGWGSAPRRGAAPLRRPPASSAGPLTARPPPAPRARREGRAPRGSRAAAAHGGEAAQPPGATHAPSAGAQQPAGTAQPSRAGRGQPPQTRGGLRRARRRGRPRRRWMGARPGRSAAPLHSPPRLPSLPRRKEGTGRGKGCLRPMAGGGSGRRIGRRISGPARGAACAGRDPAVGPARAARHSAEPWGQIPPPGFVLQRHLAAGAPRPASGVLAPGKRHQARGHWNLVCFSQPPANYNRASACSVLSARNIKPTRKSLYVWKRPLPCCCSWQRCPARQGYLQHLQHI